MQLRIIHAWILLWELKYFIRSNHTYSWLAFTIFINFGICLVIQFSIIENLNWIAITSRACGSHWAMLKPQPREERKLAKDKDLWMEDKHPQKVIEIWSFHRNERSSGFRGSLLGTLPDAMDYLWENVPRHCDRDEGKLNSTVDPLTLSLAEN